MIISFLSDFFFTYELFSNSFDEGMIMKDRWIIINLKNFKVFFSKIK